MSNQPSRPGTASGSDLRRLPLRYAGRCVLCGITIAQGVEAFYSPSARTVVANLIRIGSRLS